MYEVCDSRLACNTVPGPSVTVGTYQLSEAEFVDIVQQIRASMRRMEYSFAFNMALIAGLSFQVLFNFKFLFLLPTKPIHFRICKILLTFK